MQKFEPGDRALLGPIEVTVREVTSNGAVAVYVAPYPLSGVVETSELRRLPDADGDARLAAAEPVPGWIVRGPYDQEPVWRAFRRTLDGFEPGPTGSSYQATADAIVRGSEAP